MKQSITSIKPFIVASYHSDNLAFFLEMLNFVTSAGASLILAITALNPDMLIVYPMFLIGSISQTYASYRRKLVWIMLLMIFFTILNIVGVIRVFFRI
jgi:hypothetical protein